MSYILRKRSVRISLLLATGVGTSIVALRTSANQKAIKSIEQPQIISAANTITTDVLIVGSGAAGLTAALRLKTAGLNPLVIEKAAKVGGTSTYSGGGLWIPNTALQSVLSGHNDNQKKALTYLEAIVGEHAGPASSRERKLAFLENGPKMIAFLQSQGMKWIPTLNYPDYFPLSPGGTTGGRSVEPGMWNANLLGPWKDLLNYNPHRPPFPVHTYELSKLVRAEVSWEGRWTAVKVWGLRKWPQEMVLGRMPVTIGVSMVGQLLYLNLKAGVPVLPETKLSELVVTDGKVTGAIVERAGKLIKIETTKGVILAAGGFAQNAEMRKKYQAEGITSDWTSTVPSDQGDAISAAIKVGAATALMDSAWWGAAMRDPATGARMWCLYDRVLPHSIIVDQSGSRFTNESQNYNSIGSSIWERNKTSAALPSWLILDSQHRKRYVLAGKFMPNKMPQDALDSGFVTKADTLPELAKKITVDPASLTTTVERFNSFVVDGKDKDFGRGDSPYDQFMGDPSYKPNPNLGSITEGPFYALKVWPGDLGTRGGVLCDEYGRALKEGKSGTEVIQGLYAVGNSSASVMGRTYAGPGATLGPGLTFAFIAASKIAEQDK